VCKLERQCTWIYRGKRKRDTEHELDFPRVGGCLSYAEFISSVPVLQTNHEDKPFFHNDCLLLA
jgi:hypothetical protein